MSQWKFDPTHTVAAFSARHMMITTVRGAFDKVDGTLKYDPTSPAASYVEAVIDAASISTGFDQRDGHLRSGDFLDVANYPTITFKSKLVNVANADEAVVVGDLTIRGVTKEVKLKVERLGMAKGMQGDDRVGFTGTTKINREDFGLTWNVALEAGGVLVGKEITITLELEAIKVAEAVKA